MNETVTTAAAGQKKIFIGSYKPMMVQFPKLSDDLAVTFSAELGLYEEFVSLNAKLNEEIYPVPLSAAEIVQLVTDTGTTPETPGTPLTICWKARTQKVLTLADLNKALEKDGGAKGCSRANSISALLYEYAQTLNLKIDFNELQPVHTAALNALNKWPEEKVAALRKAIDLCEHIASNPRDIGKLQCVGLAFGVAASAFGIPVQLEIGGYVKLGEIEGRPSEEIITGGHFLQVAFQQRKVEWNFPEPTPGGTECGEIRGPLFEPEE